MGHFNIYEVEMYLTINDVSVLSVKHNLQLTVSQM